MLEIVFCRSTSMQRSEVKKMGFPGSADSAIVYTCGRCAMFYYEYKQLVEHLYWRHGTESYWCKKCGLKQWQYAAHVCNFLPIDESVIDNTIYCFCGKDESDSPMIGCDSPKCTLQWYHFKCVGIVAPPDGDWYCPQCSKHYNIQNKSKDTNTKT